MLTPSRVSRQLVAWVVALASIVLVVAVAVEVRPNHAEHDPHMPGVVFTGLSAEISIEDLVARSDAIVVLRPTGEKDVHWNSNDGRAWTTNDRSRPAYIYSDDAVVVESVIYGGIGIGPMILRKLGGTSDGAWMHFENDPVLTAGERYLVFLREYDTPTQQGSERFWTITFMDRGVFAPDGDDWYNENADLRISKTKLRDLATK